MEKPKENTNSPTETTAPKKERQKRAPGLTDTKINSAKPRKNAAGKTVAVKLSDGDGLFLMVYPTSKRWYYAYTTKTGEGKYTQTTIPLGQYPAVSLAKARKKRNEYAALLAEHVDPRKEYEKRERELANIHDTKGKTFKDIAEQFISGRIEGKFAELGKGASISESHAENCRFLLQKNVYSLIGDEGIQNIDTDKIKDLIKSMNRCRQNKKGKATKGTNIAATTWRVIKLCRSIFELALRRNLIDKNPVHDAMIDLPGRPKDTHFKAPATPQQVGALIKELHQTTPDPRTRITMAAIKILPYVFCRGGELSRMRWSELTLDGDRPAWKFMTTKTGVFQIIPLPRQAIGLLKDLEKGRKSEYVFPSEGEKQPYIYVQSMTRTLKKIWRRCGLPDGEKTDDGFDVGICAHGWRRCAKSLLQDSGIPEILTEKQLAHKSKIKTNSSYDGSMMVNMRREMLQFWADLLDLWQSGDYSEEGENNLKAGYKIFNSDLLR